METEPDKTRKRSEPVGVEEIESKKQRSEQAGVEEEEEEAGGSSRIQPASTAEDFLPVPEKRKRSEPVGVEEIESKKQRSEQAGVEEEEAGGSSRIQPASTAVDFLPVPEKRRNRSEPVGVEEIESKKLRSEQAGVEEEEAEGSSRIQSALTAVDFLPEDLILRVLSLLPARSIFRFEAACPKWRGLFRDDFFWLSSRRAPAFDIQIAYAITSVLKNELCFYNQAPATRSTFSHSFAREFMYTYLGTSNGLLAFQVQRMAGSLLTACLFLNPATHIEASLILLRLDSSQRLCGFGYCPSAKNFKILILQKGSLFVQTVVGSNMGLEPRLLCSNAISCFEPSLCLEGILYLLESTGAGGKRRNNPRLFSLMLSDDSIGKVDLPVKGRALRSGLMEMSGSICIASRGDNPLDLALWRLNPGQGWEPMFLIAAPTEGRILGAWTSHMHLLVWFDGWGAMIYDTDRGDGDPRRPVWDLSFADHFQSTGEELRPSQSNKRIVLCSGYLPTMLSPARFFSTCGTDHHALVSFVTGNRISNVPPLQFVQRTVSALRLKFDSKTS